MVIGQLCDLFLFVLFHYKVIILAQMFNHPHNLSIKTVSQLYFINLCRHYNSYGNFSHSHSIFLIVTLLVITSLIWIYTDLIFLLNLQMMEINNNFIIIII